jgi:RNA recognition motif-containing protein
VLRVDIQTRQDGNSKGFALVRMASPQAAQQAIAAYHATDLGGRSLIVTKDRGQTGRREHTGAGTSRASRALPEQDTEDGYSRSGASGRNGWVKPSSDDFVDDGPPPDPKASALR